DNYENDAGLEAAASAIVQSYNDYRSEQCRQLKDGVIEWDEFARIHADKPWEFQLIQYLKEKSGQGYDIEVRYEKVGVKSSIDYNRRDVVIDNARRDLLAGRVDSYVSNQSKGAQAIAKSFQWREQQLFDTQIP